MDFMVLLSDHEKQTTESMEQEASLWLSEDTRVEQPWPSVLALWSRDYFKRLWIIQELALNDCMTVFMCGNRQIPREVINAASSFYMREAGQISQFLLRRTSPDALQFEPSQDYVFRTAYDINNLVTFRAQFDCLETALDLARKATVINPKDKVYGMLGLLPSALAASVVPDYSRSRDQIFCELAMKMFERCVVLHEVLSWCAFTESGTLPSWVPDWSLPFPRYHIRWFCRRDASQPMGPSFSFSDDAMELRCTRVLVDKIEVASAQSSELLPYRSVAQPAHELCRKENEYGRYRNELQLRNALFRTLLHAHEYAFAVGDLTHIYWVDWAHLQGPDCGLGEAQMDELLTNCMPHIHDASNAHAFGAWNSFDGFRQTNAYFPLFGIRLKDFFPSIKDYWNCAFSEDELVQPAMQSNQDSLRMAELASTCKKTHAQRSSFKEIETMRALTITEHHEKNLRLATVALNGRRLITTRTGFLGLAPDESQVGDTVAILYGCNYPVILRRSGNGFKYVGECYIDGLMDGEAVVATKSGEYREETITLV